MGLVAVMVMVMDCELGSENLKNFRLLPSFKKNLLWKGSHTLHHNQLEAIPLILFSCWQSSPLLFVQEASHTAIF